MEKRTKNNWGFYPNEDSLKQYFETYNRLKPEEKNTAYVKVNYEYVMYVFKNGKWEKNND